MNLEHLKEVKNEILNTRSIFIKQLEKGFSQKDVRVAFFEICYDTYKNLYRVLSYSESDQFKKDSYNLYIGSQSNDVTFDLFNWKSNFQYGFIIKCWSNFEYCITQICKEKEIVSTDIIEKLKRKEYSRIIEELKNLNITNQIKNNIYQKFYKENLEHVSINLKTDQLFKVLKNTDFDSEKVEQDKEFLNFFGKLRNSVHSNYIYYGKDYEFKRGSMTYKFENGKPIKQDPLSDLSFFNLSIELRNIYQRLIEKIKFDNLIPDRNYVDSF